MFYTYAHYTPEGRLFYIGKGTGRRANAEVSRNQHWRNVVKKHGKPDVQILANWNTEAEALDHERLLISCFRDMGMKLCNLADGGNSNSGWKMPEETKQKISAACKGKWSWITGKHHSEKTKLKISQTTKGKIISEDTKKKIGASKIGNKWNLGKVYNVKYKYIGTSMVNGQTLSFVGNQEIKNFGFDPACVRKCSSGKRKTHKKYMWHKESLENT